MNETVLTSFHDDRREYKSQVAMETNIGGGRENQDSCHLFSLKWDQTGEVVTIMIMLDGHGNDLGRVASECAQATFVRFFTNNLSYLVDNTADCLQKAFQQANDDIKACFQLHLLADGAEVMESANGFLLKKRNTSNNGMSVGTWSVVQGGTTCTIAVLIKDKIFVANVGDSSAFLISPFAALSLSADIEVEDERPKPNEGLSLQGESLKSYIELTADHSPSSSDEFIRIRNFRPWEEDSRQPCLQFVYDTPRMSKTQCPAIFNICSNGQIEVTNRGHYYKNVRREWASMVVIPESDPFSQHALAFTRSLGDFHLQTYGVSSKPNICSVDLKKIFTRANTIHTSPVALCLILASDGIWDNWTFDEMSSFVFSSHSSSEIFHDGEGCARVTNALMTNNSERGNRNFGIHQDNYSTILMYISDAPTFPSIN